jgi:pimeloyl-ACP methyl ester carboxylesterase
MKSKLFIGLAVLFLSVQTYAQGVGRIAPPQEKLGTYVTDTGPGLDTGCTYRGGGPLVIQVPVPPVVNPGEIGPDGYLKNPAKLIANKVIGANAYILFPAYDVDDKTTPEPGAAPEKDVVTFNGKSYTPGVLSGFNNQWRMQEFVVPIGQLKFTGGSGGGASNELRIDIDTANANYGEVWCTAVDWVEVKLDVAAPYVLAHGINTDASTWDEAKAPGVISTLNDLGVAWNRFTVAANGSVDQNAQSLGSQIGTWLQTMKADRVHIIAHSKGGLDAQAMVANTQDFKILSLSTLSTPHYGSVISDFTILEIAKIQNNISVIQNDSPDPGGYVNTLLNQTYGTYYANQGPQLPGLKDLTTDAATQAINKGKRGDISPTFSIGASADLNGNHQLDSSEANGIASILGFPVTGSTAIKLFNTSYQILRNYSKASLVSIREINRHRTLEFSTTPTITPQENDIFVTETSANPGWAVPIGNIMANHTTIKSGDNIRKLINKTLLLGR